MKTELYLARTSAASAAGRFIDMSVARKGWSETYPLQRCRCLLPTWLPPMIRRRPPRDDKRLRVAAARAGQKTAARVQISLISHAPTLQKSTVFRFKQKPTRDSLSRKGLKWSHMSHPTSSFFPPLPPPPTQAHPHAFSSIRRSHLGVALRRCGAIAICRNARITHAHTTRAQCRLVGNGPCLL